MKRPNLLTIFLFVAGLLLLYINTAFSQDTPTMPHEPPNIMVVIGKHEGQTWANFVALDAEGIPGSEGYKVPIRNLRIEIDAELSGRLAGIEGKLDRLLGEAETPHSSVDINTATYDQMLSISGIGRIKAGAVITARDTPSYRPFEGWDDLAQRVSGVGPSTVADMQADGVQIITP